MTLTQFDQQNAVAAVRHFLSAWFHQDWDLEATTWSGVVDLFVRDRRDSPSDISDLVDALRRVASADVDLRDLGCEYDPSVDGVSPSEWLQSIAQYLESTSTRS